MKILIVEDEVRISKLLKIYLEREHYMVDIADNGNDGLIQALNEHYDLIILDILMPGKDGFKVLEELRKEKDTPAIMLSAKAEQKDQLQSLNLGANDFIAKPFSPGAVVSKVKEILSPVQ
ncbi:response regulator [Bacillus sp. FJAT-27251]|uniref:response regulator transcription factor n=1 Tax=Bacillus sp. FJAT-27251 TaxID=1684142 RepID=UPI0018D0688A|nr:response regulator [Bacillus sp. FJAT-27251]